MKRKFHAFMFPWFAFGHMIPFLHLANKLAEKGHRVTFLLPKKAQKQLEHHNLFPDSIVFHPLTIPPVNGLPAGAETTSDIPISMDNFLSEALDLTRDQVEAAVRALRPDMIFFDFAQWVPEMAKEHMIKSVSYIIVCATTIAHTHVPGGKLGVPPSSYPSSKVFFRENDAHALATLSIFYKRLYHQITTGLKNCDVIAMRTCKEIEAVKPPRGSSTVQEGLPQGFEERVKGRGVVWGGWVQQPLILSHPSIGCFVNHCGPGTIWESLVSDCQMVLIPFLSDQVLFTRLMTEEFEVSVEVYREKTGWFSKESLSNAIKSVMDKDSDLGKLVRSNHTKLKEILVSPGLLTGYVDNFVEALQEDLI
ncbi:UDP-glycosyltransferase 79B7 [Arabidopsis lyrata subsp. lyrata]|uniref:UDP-glycosyltransferase 79B7 n=1 Tax=Arabidopsis lyrata subsp. lyrata TaxID=81972 RepID=UPI000A29A33B|nr:UDP-glycosyltransferase 79B7 [Arabidopsis lyrata subsp. lyrata]|eukprot:XP_020878279.1 UDP-glycosyltransferase 79B7 [Arabidopsis lyrata subsp. lyrata]